MILLHARCHWQTRRRYTLSVLVCLCALSFAVGCNSGKPEEYRDLNPEKAGFKIVGELSSQKVDSDGKVLRGSIQSLKVDDQPSPSVKGNEYSIKLASDGMTDGKIYTADFGIIQVSSPENFAWSVRMTDTQIKKFQDFLKLKKK
jgi:hypothetical protein